jgi:tRNA pseudouridine38-40 synthase
LNRFQKLHTDVFTFDCRIDEAYFEERGNLLVFTIKADRFLRNMVRAIIGTLMEVGQGKRSLEDLRKVLLSKDRSMAGTSAPAYGLYLIDVAYPPEYTSIHE